MSAWEKDKVIYGEISRATGELLVSASDVVAWLRANADAMNFWQAPTANALADALTEQWIAATLHLVEEKPS